MALRRDRVCIIGSGNWASAIARVVAEKVKEYPFEYYSRVTMFCVEEFVGERSLVTAINERHINIKYLRGYKLPTNLVALPSLVDAAQDADILIFLVPATFMRKLSALLVGKLKPTAVGLSLIKGFDVTDDKGTVGLCSSTILRCLKIPCSAFIVSNLPKNVLEKKYFETTIGCADKKAGRKYKQLLQSENLRCVIVDDSHAVEICGILRFVIACGAGLVDGLGYGHNTKATMLRLGLMEVLKFIDIFHPGSKILTLFESCGVAELILACYKGRDRKAAEEFVRTGKTFDEIQSELEGGQLLYGPKTAAQINNLLAQQNVAETEFPLFTAIHKICSGQCEVSELITCIQGMPNAIYTTSNMKL